jgi:hypothetical protein
MAGRDYQEARLMARERWSRLKRNEDERIAKDNFHNGIGIPEGSEGYYQSLRTRQQLKQDLKQGL